MKLVLVEWIDSCSPSVNGWECINEVELKPPSKPWTVGFILEETEDCITLVQTISGDQILGRITIPKVAIFDIYHLDSPLDITKTDKGLTIQRKPEERSTLTKLKEGAP